MSRHIATIAFTICISIFIFALPVHPSEHDSQEAAIASYREGKLEEAGGASDRLIAENPNNDQLKIWRALVSLEQARRMRESKTPGYKNTVVREWAVLKRLRRRNYNNPEWCLAVAKAYWLNDRSKKGRKAIEKALYYRSDFPEAKLLLGDIYFDEALENLKYDPDEDSSRDAAANAANAYQEVLVSKSLLPVQRAEALFKLGLVESVLRK